MKLGPGCRTDSLRSTTVMVCLKIRTLYINFNIIQHKLYFNAHCISTGPALTVVTITVLLHVIKIFVKIFCLISVVYSYALSIHFKTYEGQLLCKFIILIALKSICPELPTMRFPLPQDNNNFRISAKLFDFFSDYSFFLLN